MRQLASKRFLVVIFIFAAALLFYFFMRPAATPHVEGSTAEPSPKKDSSVPQNSMTTQPTETNRGATNEAAAPPEEQAKELRDWISTEAQSLNSTRVDTRQKDRELQQKVETFTPEQKRQLLEVAHDTSAPVNDRILAAYLFVLDHSTESAAALGDLASKGLPDFGPLNAHSEAELRRGQELSVRYMAIDELAKRAPTDPDARAQLSKLATSADSPEVRRYAQKALEPAGR